MLFSIYVNVHVASEMYMYYVCVQTLLQHGADVNWCDADGNSLALSSAQAGHVTSLEFLIGRGADIELANKDYDTPLHWAIYTYQSYESRVVSSLFQRSG